MNKVWITGNPLGGAAKSLRLQALSANSKAVEVSIAKQHVLRTRPTPNAPSTDYLVPRWLAEQEKLAYEIF